MDSRGTGELVRTGEQTLVRYLMGDAGAQDLQAVGDPLVVVPEVLSDEGARASIMDVACECYRSLIKKDERRACRYFLWDPHWESSYVDLLLRKGRSHGDAARRVTEICGGLHGKEVLEVGCGFGRMAAELALQGGNVTAVEISEDYLRIARLIAAALGLWAGHDSIRFLRGAAELLPVESNRFDVVWSDQTIEHVGDIERSLTEMVRVLRPGGLLFVRCPNYLSVRMREPHLGTFWPPYLPRSAYRWLIARDYSRRARRLKLGGESRRIASSAIEDAVHEADSLSFVKPYQVARILSQIKGISWSFVRSAYRPARKRWKRPAKWLWYQGRLDILLGGSIFVMATKGSQTLIGRLGCRPEGIWDSASAGGPPQVAPSRQ